MALFTHSMIWRTLASASRHRWRQGCCSAPVRHTHLLKVFVLCGDRSDILIQSISPDALAFKLRFKFGHPCGIFPFYVLSDFPRWFTQMALVIGCPSAAVRLPNAQALTSN